MVVIQEAFWLLAFGYPACVKTMAGKQKKGHI